MWVIIKVINATSRISIRWDHVEKNIRCCSSFFSEFEQNGNTFLNSILLKNDVIIKVEIVLFVRINLECLIN